MTQRIAINCRFSGVAKPTGTHTVGTHLVDGLVRHPERNVTLTLLIEDEFARDMEWEKEAGVEIHPIPFGSYGRLRTHLWEQVEANRLAKSLGCAAIHHLMNTCPRFSGDIPQITTVHDLNFYLHPEWFSRPFRYFLRYSLMPGIRNSASAVCITKHVRSLVAEHVGIPASDLLVIYNGLKPLVGREKRRERSKSILMVNAWQPHKNLPRVLEAFHSFRHLHPEWELRIAGRKQALFHDDGADLSNLADQPGVSILGYISDEELADEYASAGVFCMPSLEEGFGLPVIEALASGVPVITSNLSCLPEVAGPDGILVDPYSVSEIAGALGEAANLSDPERSAMHQRSLDHIAQFSWRKSARSYLDLYETFLR
ncbi:MAG: glycosyltransferase family 1 protein [Verrucomicrobiota bacterium]